MKHGHKFLIAAPAAIALALVLAAPWGQASMAVNGIIYVDADAGGANNGTSWGDAYTDLQVALETAVAGKQIWVAAGTYKPTSGTDRTISFQMMNGVALYGGFDPSVGDIAFDDRDWVLHETILSGDIGAEGDDSDNSYHVFYHPDGTNLDSTAILDGFAITDGNANGDDPHVFGGGMYNDGSSPTLTNCIFEGNSATVGGGMYNKWYSSPVLTDCIFSYNSATSGGGVYNDGSSPILTNCTLSGNSASYGGGMSNYSASTPTLADCTFSGNSATSLGGGMHNYGSSPALTNCTFSGNSSGGGGGGMINYNGSSPEVTNCTFEGNSADSWGGGMHNQEGSSPTLTDLTFSGNSAGQSGGGMYNSSSSPALINCTFEGNSAASWGGGMHNTSLSSPTLTNCAFHENSAGSWGGGMYNGGGCSPILTNAVFSGNSAGIGGGVYNYGSSAALTNCILWGNNPDQIFNDSSVPAVTYSDIQGGHTGEGNIDAYPFFVDPGNGDFHLGACSPCIDAGDNDAPDLPPYDFEGDDRIIDGDEDGEDIVDMGVDEVAVVGTCFRVYLPLVLRAY